MSVLSGLSTNEQSLFREIVGRDDAQLLTSLEQTESPSLGQRHRVMDILIDEFNHHVSGPDWEPSPQGRDVDNLLGQFLLHFPISP